MLLLENLENTEKQKEEENLMSPTPTPRQSLFFSMWFYVVELMQHGQRHTRDSQMEDAIYSERFGNI